MRTYMTKEGDMWDRIAYRELGSASYTDKIISLNPKHISCLTFPAGIELILPDTDVGESIPAPPWKAVAG